MAAIARCGNGCPTTASWGRAPFQVPPALAGLPGQELLLPRACFPAPRPRVTFAAPDLQGPGQFAGTVIVLDDHDSSTRLGDVHLMDPDIEVTVVWTGCWPGSGFRTAEITAPLSAGLSSGAGSFRHRGDIGGIA